MNPANTQNPKNAEDYKYIKTLKNKAKKLKKQTAQPHHICLTAVAQLEGYQTWESLVNTVNGGKK